MERPMEEILRATSSQIDDVRKKMAQSSENAGLCPEDLERVKSDEMWIRRFIAAQDGDVDKAAKMLLETCQWRKEFGVNDLDHKNISQGMIEKGTLFIRNKDKWGKDLLIFKAKTHNKGVNDMEEVKKFIVYWFERAERLTKSDQITLIFDMKDSGWSNMDMDFIKYLIMILKEYYPYLVNWLLIYDMPWILKSAWTIIKALLDKKSVDRIKFADKKMMSDYVDLDNQLVDWGGKDSYEYSFEPEVKVQVNQKRKSSLKTLSLNNNLSSSEDSSPEGKARKGKVQFTDRDGTTDLRSLDVVEVVDRPRNDNWPPESPPPPRRMRHRDRMSPPSAGDASPMLPSHAPTPSSRILLETSEVINFEWNGEEEAGRIDIRNLTQDMVIFKIKTTAPDSYRVYPSIGIVNGSSEASSSVAALGDIDVRQHRFQIQSAILPQELARDLGADDSDSGGEDFARLNLIWKNSIERSGNQIFSARIRCAVTARVAPNPAPRTAAAPSGVNVVATADVEVMRRGLLDLLHQYAELSKKADATNISLGNVMRALYIVIGAVLFFGVLLYFSIPSGCIGQGAVVSDLGGQCPGSTQGSISVSNLNINPNPDPGSDPGPSGPTTPEIKIADEPPLPTMDARYNSNMPPKCGCS